MKIKYVKIAFCAMLLMTTMASCGKEEPLPIQGETGNEQKQVVLVYWVDGETHQALLGDESELRSFMTQLVALTQEGHRVTIAQGTEQLSMVKDKVTFTTNDPDEMAAWMAEMALKGYKVSVVYDKETGVFTGTATN